MKACKQKRLGKVRDAAHTFVTTIYLQIKLSQALMKELKGPCSYNLCTVELIRSVTIIEELFSGVVFSTVPKPKSPNLQ